MNDMTSAMSQLTSWQMTAWQITQLLRKLPIPSPASILVLLPESDTYEALCAAAAALSLNVVTMPMDSSQEGVARAIAHQTPSVVVCRPEVFGWVSKLAFLGGCLAIYTCGEEGEGTLLDRAAHFEPVPLAEAQVRPMPPILKLDTQGTPVV